MKKIFPDFDWSRLSKMQLGKYAEHFAKMRLLMLGLEVYVSEVDDRGIDFVVKRADGVFWEIQSKSLRGFGYVFLRKEHFQPREGLFVALTFFKENEAGDIFLIPSTEWIDPKGIFVERNYGDEGQKSKPEWGINVSEKGMDQLRQFSLTRDYLSQIKM